MILYKTKMRNTLGVMFTFICLAGMLPQQAHAAKPSNVVIKITKERLVLMPLRVTDEDKNLQGAMETALVEGLQQKYEVFSGEQVAQKARQIFLKESRNVTKKECDETRCMQDIAEAFQAELIATANVTKREDGYFLALSIQNIFDNKVEYSKSLPCKNCDAYQVVDKLKVLITLQEEPGQAARAVAIPIRKDDEGATRVEEQKGEIRFFAEPGSLQGLRSNCAFSDQKLPKDFAVYAAGAYGGKKLDVQIDQSGHQASQFDIVVNSPEKPAVLILGAYEPSIWNIGWTKGTRILAVLASGYHRQAVAGLPEETPLLISTNDNQGPCGYVYVTEKMRSKLNPLSERVFDRPVDMVHIAANGKAVVGVSLKQGEPLFTSRDVTPESFFNTNKPHAGLAGLEDAVAKGIIRSATQEDAEAWASRKAKTMQKNALPTVSGGDNSRSSLGSRGSAFVILKAFRLPEGLYGGNSAIFYLLDGVPYPKGDLGHSSLYDFNTMTCRGVMCVAP